MKRIATLSLAAMLLPGGAAAPASAQLTAASEGPVVYGHHHLNVTDAAAHKRFWADTLGGTPTPFGRSEIYKFPNVLVFAREGEPTGGTRGSTVNHLGFRVPSVRAMLSKVRAAGFPIKFPNPCRSCRRAREPTGGTRGSTVTSTSVRDSGCRLPSTSKR